jgi:hypothetical protein
MGRSGGQGFAVPRNTRYPSFTVIGFIKFFETVIPEKGVFCGTQNVSPLSGTPLRVLAALNESGLPSRSLRICCANAGRAWNDAGWGMRACDSREAPVAVTYCALEHCH